MNLQTSIGALNRVGKTSFGRLKSLGLNNVQDLLFYFPFRYEDYSVMAPISQLRPLQTVTVRVKVQMIANRRSFRKRKILTQALVADDTGTLKVLWFNQPFLQKNLKVGDEIFLSGKVDESGVQLISPEYEKVKINSVHTARIVPIYHTVAGVTQKQLRFLISQVLPCLKEVIDYLPAEIISRHQLLALPQALQNIHFPQNSSLAKLASLRLKFDELFLVQLAIAKFKKQLKSHRAFKLAFLEKQTKEFVAGLPFTLTGAQKRSAWEILQDLQNETPMNRLLEGDVGSGKTVVAALALLNVVLNGYKAVLLAPTEILAQQHYASLIKLFSKQKFNIALLTGSQCLVNDEKQRKKVMAQILSDGQADIIVGTHAVIQENVKIKDLGLVIVDEQHRFGVEQRKALLNRDAKQNLTPHFLSMTATPIPRSLVLTLYGDLDLSIINEMPANRKTIITKIVYEQDRDKAYDFIRKQVGAGEQVFVICPLIDPSDSLGVKSVKQEYARLQEQIFPDLKVGLLHGRMKSTEKEQTMTKFKNKEYDILVATSVIEVGIDIKNATIMMIEGADRFGLSQLHQFRGRVGRGDRQSYCLLFSDNNSALTRQRLNYLVTCSDGFSLAQKDLELRGPGEVYGTRQSGLPDLKIASLADVELIKLAAQDAQELLQNGELSVPLEKALQRTNVSLHFE